MKVFVLIGFLASFNCIAQESELNAKWVKGEAILIEKNLSPQEMKNQVLNNARKKALEKAGIKIESREILMRTESGIDFYASMAELDAQGVIIDERNISISEILPIKQAPSLYRIQASLEALVVQPKGNEDKAFHVSVSTKRNPPIYRHGDAITLEIETTKKGYLTIFNIVNDTVSVIFPNSLTKTRVIKNKMKFPESSNYEMVMQAKPGEARTIEHFIVVVTKENIPFLSTPKVSVENEKLALSKTTRFNFTRWLAMLPLNERALQNFAVTVIKK